MARGLDTALPAAIKSFLNSRWDLRPTTKHGYQKSIERFGRMLNEPTIGDLSQDAVNAYLESIADHKTMARNDCIALRQLSKWATKSGIFPRDPLDGIELPKAKGGRRKPFLDDEVRAIVASAEDSDLGTRDKAIVVLGLSAAMRPRELWMLQLSDIDLEGRWVSIRVETTKTDAGERSIPLDEQAVACLDSYIHDHRGTEPGALWLNAKGQPFTYWGFMAVFGRLSRRMKTQGIAFSAYRSRHTGITNWARVGLNAPVMQQLAGHKSIVTTQRYIGKIGREDLARLPSAFTKLYGRVG